MRSAIQTIRSRTVFRKVRVRGRTSAQRLGPGEPHVTGTVGAGRHAEPGAVAGVEAGLHRKPGSPAAARGDRWHLLFDRSVRCAGRSPGTVSYTHLTLPTN